jgi:exopolysaccharide biosynthesis polyprenyl glycosylphosphotransferase
VVAISRTYQHLLSTIITELQRLPVHILMMPDVADLSALNVGITELGDAPALKLRAPILSDMQLSLKRVVDIAIVSVVLPFVLPLMGLIALTIRLDSPGPILFRQRRVGQYGRQFTMLKFRTMVPDAEQRMSEVTTYAEDGRPLFKGTAQDPRVTRVGRVLRRFSLDELPQMFNVLLGQMSLVGPRPELPTYVGFYDKWQHLRLWVPPGITGWWQINGREQQPMYLNWEDDLYYIRNYSLLLDLQILWLTVTHALLGSTGR